MLRHLPNIICLVRIALIWPTIDALYSGRNWTALILVAICAVSDGVDGWLAKAEGDEAERLAALKATLKCGSNCGSCIPELKRRVRATHAQLSI